MPTAKVGEGRRRAMKATTQQAAQVAEKVSTRQATQVGVQVKTRDKATRTANGTGAVSVKALETVSAETSGYQDASSMVTNGDADHSQTLR